MNHRIGYLRLVYRLPGLVLHLLIGTPLTVLCQSPRVRALRVGDYSLGDVMISWWSKVVCMIFGVRRRAAGRFVSGAQLVAANHISWLDIMLLNSQIAMGFVAKAEISGWPVIGWLAKIGGTVFHQRGSHDSASGAALAMADRLREDRKVAIFPEGGILAGDGVKRFHARLFSAAIETGVPVQPVMLRYMRDGRRYDEITFLPEEHFVANFFRLLGQRRCTGEVRVLAPIAAAERQRRQLAHEAEEAVRSSFESEVPHE